MEFFTDQVSFDGSKISQDDIISLSYPATTQLEDVDYAVIRMVVSFSAAYSCTIELSAEHKASRSVLFLAF
jgi:predicted nucleotidyltransferase